MATQPTDAASLSDQYQKALGDIRADSQYGATTGAFDEGKGVAGRVNQLTSSANPLFTAAETRSKQQSASRGLLNSSIAAQAGQQAVIETAMPIANADASLYQQQQLANQQAANDAAARNASNRMNVGMLGFQTGESARQFDASIGQRQKEFATSTGQTQQQIDAQKEQFAQTLGMSSKDLDLRRDQLSESQRQFLQSLDQQKAQLAQQQSQYTSSQSQQQSQFQATQLQQTVMAKMDSDTRTKLAELDAASRQSIQGSSNIANAWGTMMTGINSIQNNANLEEGTKQVLIQNTINSFQSFANFWQKTNGVDVTDLLNFNAGQVAPSPAPAAPIYDPNVGIPGIGDRGGGG